MLPRVILHNAVSLDGRIDWFTPDIGQFYELASRWKEDATLAGSETMLNPPEPVPDEDPTALDPPKTKPNDSRPLLVIPDSRGRVRSWHFWRVQPYWRGLVALCSRATPPEYLDYLRQRHVDTIVTGDDHVDLGAALEELNARFGVNLVRADSGGTLNGLLLRAGLVHEVSVLIHARLVGGTIPRSMFHAPELTAAEGVIPLRLMHVEKMAGDLVWLRYEVVK